MDCCSSSIKRIPSFEAFPIVVKSQRKGASFFAFSNSSRKSTLYSQNHIKVSRVPESGQHIHARRRSLPSSVVIANADSRAKNLSGVGTPLKPSSPEGKFLSGVLQFKRHLFRFAVSEQLDELASDRNGAVVHNKQSPASMESLLYRRIAEMKENKCQNAVEDVMYMSIVHKFSENDVPMIPKLSRCIIDNSLDICPSKCRELESIHNLNVQEMIGKHFATVVSSLGNASMMDGSNRIKIDRLHLGQIYASTITYGYFLKSACLRHQLELCLAQSHRDLQHGHGTYPSFAELYPSRFKPVGKSEMCHVRHENLSSYVMGFDTESLQRCARLKSKEAMNLIKKHTWALFGGGRIGEGSCDNNIVVTFPSLKRLVLEALTFGSFLWDVERSVDYVYKLMEN